MWKTSERFDNMNNHFKLVHDKTKEHIDFSNTREHCGKEYSITGEKLKNKVKFA